jgi:hypothetical protein
MAIIDITKEDKLSWQFSVDCWNKKVLGFPMNFCGVIWRHVRQDVGYAGRSSGR